MFFYFSYMFFVKIIFEVILNSLMPLSILYMVKFSKGFWYSFLTAFKIRQSSFTLSSSCKIASVCFTLISLTLFVMFSRILFLFCFNFIILSMTVVLLILTRSCFCFSSDIWCNWSSDVSLLQLGSLKPKLSFAHSGVAFLMWGNVID